MVIPLSNRCAAHVTVVPYGMSLADAGQRIGDRHQEE
ncbi:hypothetical protein IWX64_003293 [Arthrobacter sp. CAN_A212]